MPVNYQDLRNANPYVGVSYRKSPWQNFLTKLGFRTEADAWEENMQVQANEYEQAILQKQYDEEYNDPIRQTARMRAAGINPDINGGDSIDSGSAQPLGDDPSTPMQSTGDESKIVAFANGVMNIFTTSLGLAQSVQGVVRNRLENSILSINESSTLAQFAKDMSPFFIPETSNMSEDGESWSSSALTLAKIFSSRALPKKLQDRFVNTAETFWNGVSGNDKAYSLWKDRISSKKSYELESSTFYNRESDEVLSIISDELSKLNEQIIKSSMKSQVAQNQSAEAEAQYNERYYNSLDAGAIAGSETSQAEFNKTNMDMNKLLNQSLGNMIDKLDEASKQDGFKGGLASIAMALLASFRLMITTQGLPSVSRSASSRTNNSHSSESLSIDW